ncbi:hypothetical protein GCM10010149_47570 [Nonomuraea roseoviolacea subsp. roseoviolacea]|uniref:hypothetical protein n=1 Tax=Nonomuraea roseoviolacea TaxID=103837 RepID=UPI0031D4BBBC
MAVWPRTTIELATPKDVAEGAGGFYVSRFNLTSGAQGIVTLPGVKGFDAPPFSLAYDELPALDGGHPRHSRATSREVFIPVHMSAPDRPSLLALKRSFVAALNPTFGPCRITVTEGDGSRRFIDAYYVAGAEGDEGQDLAGFEWVRYGLQFRALDPYWYSGETVERIFRDSIGDLKPFFSAPFLGLNINRTFTLNQSTVLTVTGDVETWPEWRVNGPVDGLTFTRADTDGTTASFSMDVTLTPTQSAYIDTRPGRKRATLLDGTETNLWDTLGPNPNLWSIKPGDNTVTLAIDGTGASTSVNLTYRPRFISA